MDGIHDVGGMQGFGPLPSGYGENGNDGESGFHEPWEGLAHSAFVATMGSRVHGIDEFRHAIERMRPAHYLNAAYYDRWLVAVSTLAVENDVLSAETLRERTAAVAAGERAAERSDPALAEDLIEGVVAGYDAWREGSEREPTFDVGEAVRVRNVRPDGHTRCPGYVRNARGTVAAHRGIHTLPEASVHDDEGDEGNETAEPLYNVAFETTELWSDERGSDAEESGDVIRVELWESHLRRTER